MPKVRVGDIEMYYVEQGSGEPLVLIMGFSGDHTAWAFQMAEFAQRYRVIAFDNRGAGQTDQPDAPYTIPQMAGDTAGLMDRLGIERAHVLGVSMGGMIAQELALAHPGRVLSLQLHCTHPGNDGYMTALGDAWGTVRASLPLEQAQRTIFLWLFGHTTYNERPEFVEAILAGALANPYPQSLAGFRGQSAAVQAFSTRDRLPRITAPTLVSVADEDVLVPARFAREIAARIPGAELATIARAGHVYFWEMPEEFNRMCLEFLARHPK
ncbi:MAG: alpha/beta fold hydrolase [Candidatus Rokubacteria bacterium]|nr:alpha/beta fold hydrolase [Candidatus Rokubacteria bacterium]MBI3825311.1 alpha/beta fold hydrolase [Candidatus Rokubacteria bacterium]